MRAAGLLVRVPPGRVFDHKRAGMRHCGAVGIGSRAVVLAVLSVATAVVLGYEAGTKVGAMAGVLAALAGFLPAVVWELARDWRERSARAVKKRETALKVFKSAEDHSVRRAGLGWSERGAAWLLRPEAGVVAFRPRPELEQLIEWCAAAGRLRIRLVTGEGGSGKTRLALQLAADLAGHGWRTLWVERGQEGTAVNTVRNTGEPAVLVVDYAETRPGLAGLLAEAAVAEDCPDLRIVLLARSAGEWWQQLLAGADYLLNQVLQQAVSVTLGPLTDAAGQEEVFDEAVTAFAGLLGTARPDVRLTLDDPYAVVLVVHAAALLAVLDHANTGCEPERVYSAGDVLTGVLGHEARYWHQSAISRGLVLDTAVERLAVSVACLVGADNETDAIGLLARLPDLVDSAERRGQVARWLHDLYPTPVGDGTHGDWLGPLRPNRVAEHLVTRELEDRHELVPSLLAGLDHQRLVRALTILSRAAPNDAGAGRLLHHAIEGGLEHLAIPALTVAVETNPDVGEVLAAALTARRLPLDVLEQVAAALPYPTFALAEAAAEVFRQLVAQAIPGSSERARLLSRLSIRLADLGQREEALTAIDQATTTYIALARTQPNAFLPSLATALNNQSAFLARLGRWEKALTAIDLAVTIRRALAEAQPEAFLHPLAGALTNQSNCLSGLGRREEALTAIEEAVAACRTLATTEPDAVLPDLAMALNNQSLWLTSLGRREEALAAIEEAATIRYALAKVRPDAFLPDLAASLNNLATCRSSLGQHKNALATIEDAVTAYRWLATTRPEAFLPALAASLNNLATCLSSLEQDEKALVTIEEVVTIYRSLAATRPDAFLSDLAGSLGNQSALLALMGRQEEALFTIEEAITAYRSVASTRPDAFLPDLATALNNKSICVSDLGRWEEALAAIEEVVTIRRTLARDLPKVFASSYSGSLRSMAAILTNLGLDAEAQIARNEAAAASAV